MNIRKNMNIYAIIVDKWGMWMYNPVHIENTTLGGRKK